MGVAWLDLKQTHSIKAYVGKFQGVVSTLQHVLDYNKWLKFIYRLQPWACKLIFWMPQLPNNLQGLMWMAERLGDNTVDKKEPGGKVRLAKVGKDNNSSQERKKRKRTNMCTRSSSPSPTMRQKGESQRHERPVNRPETRMYALGAAKKAT